MDTPTGATTEQMLERLRHELARGVAIALRNGREPTEVVNELAAMGLDREAAQSLVDARRMALRDERESMWLATAGTIVAAPLTYGACWALAFLLGVIGAVLNTIAPGVGDGFNKLIGGKAAGLAVGIFVVAGFGFSPLIGAAMVLGWAAYFAHFLYLAW